jgi:uncharacterized protein DUF6893
MNVRLGVLALVAVIAVALAWQWPEVQRYLKVRQM